MLLEVVGPEIQSLYDDRQIEIEMVDMHFGTGPFATAVDLNPKTLQDHLSEISCCKRDSKNVFFIVSWSFKIKLSFSYSDKFQI